MTVFTKEEKQLIDDKFQELLSVAHKSTKREYHQIIKKAFNLANDAHNNMRRKSGEPYILHPIAVARIATHEIGLGTKSIVASLLHDVVEDTDISIEDINYQFGEKIASIVDGLTKLSGVSITNSSMQAENFRKILMTMSEDMRVIFIKLADRLHNMRTLDSMPRNKQLKIAGETLFIYAPLAHRLGLFLIKEELEDLCLKYLHPSEYQLIAEKRKETEKQQLNYINRFSLPITNQLNHQGIEFEINGRAKSIYSIWQKMQVKKVTIDEIYDLFAIRIIFKPKENESEKMQCWNIYSIITNIYELKPDRIRDWISQPRTNGYEALHITVMGPEGKWVEIQIRTQRMDEIAERGYAAHWKYKGLNQQEGKLDIWLKEIREMLENPKNDTFEFLDDFKMNLFSSEIMVFSPKGEIITLPTKSTALDFAFLIHTEVGSHAIGAKINHKLVPLNTEIKSGDQIEILTSKTQEPDPQWLKFVTTARAKSKLKSLLKEKRKQLPEEGKIHLEYLLSELGLQPNSNIFRKLFNYYGTRNKEKLYYKIGEDKFDKEILKNILKKRSKNKWIKFWEITTKSKEITKKENKSKSFVIDQENTNYEIAKCCNPIPGDDVIGYKLSENTVIIHNTSCPNAIKLNSIQSDKVARVEWATHKIFASLARIVVKGIDKIGIVNGVTTILSKELSVNMRAINLESHDGIFEGTIDIYVHNTEDLNQLINDLKEIKGVTQVHRKEIKDESMI